jgi:hypothetical protein
MIAWVFPGDRAMLGFLEPSGWACDGVWRELDMGEKVSMIRLHTDISK